jgi:hypothetical protein
MSKSKSVLLLFSLAGTFAACLHQRQPIATQIPSNNKDYKVEYLFEHEGCKVYRFQDLGRWVYFTNCNGEAIVPPDSTAEIRNQTRRRQ